jgi:hypothetical protein
MGHLPGLATRDEESKLTRLRKWSRAGKRDHLMQLSRASAVQDAVHPYVEMEAHHFFHLAFPSPLSPLLR